MFHSYEDEKKLNEKVGKPLQIDYNFDRFEAP